MNIRALLVFPALVCLSLTAADGLPPQILSSYVQGVEHFNDTLISLVNYKNDAKLKAFFSGLFQSVKSSHESFSKSRQAASNQHQKLNQNQASVQSQIDSQRTSLQGKIAEKASKEKQLVAQQQSLQQSERHLQNTEQNLRNLEGAVREAEKKVEEARNCLHKRKKRGFGLGKVFKKVRKAVKKVHREVKRVNKQVERHVIRPVVKPIVKPIERGICGIVNELTGNLRDKKRLRDQAQRDVANYRSTVAQARQAVQNTQARLTALTTEIQSAQTSIANLNQQIAKLASEQKNIIALKEKITKVDQHLATVVNRMGTSADAIKISQAALLIAEIEDAIDFENVIQPLVEAGQLISGGSSAAVPQLLQLTPANRQKIVDNVGLLQNMLNSLQEAHGEDANLFSNLDD